MDILYIGDATGNSLGKAQTLERLGHKVTIAEPVPPPFKRLASKWLHQTGGFGLEPWLRARIIRRVSQSRFDLAFVNQGAWAGPMLVRALKQCARRVVNFNWDDPFGGRDHNSWTNYLRALPEYDLVVVVREPNIQEAYASGAKRVLRVFMTANEVAHAPRVLTSLDIERWRSEVLFVGTWMPERGGFLAALMKAGLPLTIVGDRWQKAPEWSTLKTAWRGGAVEGDDYARAIQCAKISLGLLSKGNRDLHTTRSIEIPCLGGLLCAERTSEHLKLYRESVDAIFWSDARECAEQCRKLLLDEPRRRSIAESGRRRCLENGLFESNVLNLILDKALN